MESCLVLSMENGALLIAQAFRRRGVVLAHPARSRSGLREADGVVVFAMPRSRVRVNDWGCSCPLWLPVDAGPRNNRDAGVAEERFQHCRLAMQLGMAEGFLLDAQNEPATDCDVLSLHVMQRGAEFWATWGGVARSRTSESEVTEEEGPRAPRSMSGA